MAQIIEFVGNAPDAAKLFAFGNDTVVATAASVSPATNRKSIFAASFSGVSVGEYQFIAFDGVDGDAIWTVAITSANGVFTAYERSVNAAAGASNGTVTRSLTDTEPIQFSWPVTGATLTGEVDFNSANDYQPVLGTFNFLYTEGGVHYYTLSRNAADRPTTEGTARYKVTDGVRTKWFNLRMAVSSSGGGDLEEIKGPGWDEDTDTLEKIRDAIAAISTLSVVIPSPVAEVIGMPETLEIGDSYDDETPIKLYIRDDADDPVTVFSGHDLADSDFAPTFVIAPTPGNPRGRVKGNVTYVPASGPDEGYLKIEIPSLQSRRAVEGESSVQCVLKWDGYEKTLLNTTVRWLPRI